MNEPTEVALEDLVRREHPDATDKDVKAMVWLIETYRESPKHLKDKMQQLMMLLANGNQRALKLCELAADGKITFRQALETL